MKNNLFSEKFSTHLKNVLVRATELATFNNEAASKNAIDSARPLEEQRLVSPQTQTTILSVTHIIEALSQETGSIGAEIIKKSAKPQSSAITTQTSRGKIANKSIRKSYSIEVMLSSTAAKVLVKAVQISHQFGHRYIGTEHLLKSLIKTHEDEIENWFNENSVSKNELEKNINVVLESTSKFPDLTAVFRPESDTETKVDKKQNSLEYFGQELTDRNVQKNIDPLVGREIEIERVIGVLCRRYKNNPLLLGEAGVGKTAIVEGLAKRISQGSIPPILANKKIYSLDLGSMVAGTIYRGEFEARLKSALETAEKEGNVILFIDEIHTIIGAGSASGSLDAANMLKPALARGSISIIGATTLEEYKKHIETDSALERRLQPIIIDEPTEQETKEVLAGIRKNYESFHGVVITDEAIDAAVSLSSRYLPEKLQPDKSIDLIDEASARAKVERSNNDIWQKIRSIESELRAVQENKLKSVALEKYSDAITFKEKEHSLRSNYELLLKQTQHFNDQKVTITRDHVVGIISRLTKIPLGTLQSSERQKLTELSHEMKKIIVGQDIALDSVASLIRRARTNVADPNRPIASFMFLGPSGVGKTETAKQLSRIYFNNPKSLIRVDMSEFSESFSISKLIGSPAGYVGYRDSNRFTDLVRTNPYSVVLLDEIEKAHPEIFNLLLQILDEGQLMDSTGRAVNFRNTIICMTSNIGLSAFNKAANIGFSASDASEIQETESEVHEQLKSHFRPEFLNRVDKTIIYKPLTQVAYNTIVGLYLNELNTRLIDENIEVVMSPDAQNHVVTKGYGAETGARGVRRFFQDNIEGEIAQLLLAKDTLLKQTIKVETEKEKLVFSAE